MNILLEILKNCVKHKFFYNHVYTMNLRKKLFKTKVKARLNIKNINTFRAQKE